MKPEIPDPGLRALALFERLSDRPSDTVYRSRLLAKQGPEVIARLEALERGAARGTKAMPTQLPGAVAASDMPPPEQVGVYRLTDPLGSGGMGQVWKAERSDGLFDQVVAIKLLHSHLVRLAGGRFSEERRLLAKLEHPGIARLIDGGVLESGTPYLVMEFVAGRPIDEAAQGLTERAKVELLLQAAQAVQFAHENLIVHADLKPSNLMVDSAGRLRLLDFGIARLVTEDAGQELLPMTHDYASPARLAGAAPIVADDVFALGVVLDGLIGQTRDMDLASVVARARAPDAVDRYGSVAALISELERWRNGFPVLAQPDNLAYRARRFIGRHRLGVVLATLAVLALTATSVVATVSSVAASRSYARAERARIEAETRFLEVRDLSRFMLFDLYDDLADSPGTVASRARLAQTAGRYLEHLQRVPDAPIDLREDIIRGWRRLAAVQGLSGVASLGDPEAAGRALDRAEAEIKRVLAEDPNNISALEELGWVEAGRWTLHSDNPDSAKLASHARELFAAVLKRDPARDSARLGTITMLKSQGYDLIWADKPADAIPVLRSALTQLRAHSFKGALGRDAQILEVGILGRLGDATYYAGDKPGALPFYREQEALALAALARKQSIIWTRQFGEAEFNLSGTLAEMPGHLSEALAYARRGTQAIEAALAFGPDANLEKQLLVLYAQESLVLVDMGRAKEAVTVSQRNINLREARLRRSPKDPQRNRDVAVGLPNHALILNAAGMKAQACASAQRAVAVWKSIELRGDLGSRDAKNDVPEARAAAFKYCG